MDLTAKIGLASFTIGFVMIVLAYLLNKEINFEVDLSEDGYWD